MQLAFICNEEEQRAMSPFAEALHAYLDPLLHKHKSGGVIIYEDLASSWNACQRQKITESKNSHTAKKQQNELKMLHNSQLLAYQQAAKQALTTFAQSVNIPVLLDGESEDNYYQRIRESLDIPAWTVEQSVLDDCVDFVLQKRISQIFQEHTSAKEQPSESEKESTPLEKEVDSENSSSNLKEDENDESKQIALVLAGLSQNKHEYVLPATAPQPVVKENQSQAPSTIDKPVAVESKPILPASTKPVTKENKPPVQAPTKPVIKENKTSDPTSKSVKKTTTAKGVSTRGRTSNAANNTTKAAPKKAAATNAKAMQTRAARGRKANGGRGRGKGANASGSKNNKKNAAK